MLKATLSSIGIKLFLSFWIITIISVVTTRFISEQFKQQGQIKATHHGDTRTLKRIATNITSIAPSSPNDVINLLPKRKNKKLLLKNMETSEVLYAKRRHLPSVIHFLSENNLESLTTIQFDFFRMTGPVKIAIEKTPYQLYVVSRTKKDHFGNWIFDLPAWTRVVIPLIVSFILYWLLARSLTKPIIAIKDATRKFGDGEFTARVQLSRQRNDEIGDCAKSFNLMAEKLEQNIEAHQRLLADVSHELRSPMTRLQIALGLAQQKDITQEILSKHLERCGLEVSRLDEMIANVLSLSRMENIINQMELMSVDVSQLLNLCVEDAQYIANEKGINIILESDNPPIIEADPNLLASAFNNILTNAIKYSHQNDNLRVIISTQRTILRIEFIDMGIGVPVQALAKLFEPFYRVEQARDRTSGGTGLGMAIAKQAIIAHQGTIQAENNSFGGLSVIMTLPLSSNQSGRDK